MKEEWKPVKEDNRYYVSNLGRVKSFAKGPERILRQSYHKDYFVVSINRKYKVVHRLVAESFIPNDKNLPLVDHKNGDRTNNTVSNLRWLNHLENNKNRNTKRDIKYPDFLESEINSEIWVDIPENLFKVKDLKISNLGRIKKPYKAKNNLGCYGSETITSYGASEKNYCEVKKNGRRFKLHRLVWECFKGPIPGGYQVNHKDNNKINNRLSNLELLTPSENIKYNYKTNNVQMPYFFDSERIGNIINSFYLEGKCSVTISKEFRTGPNDVLNILKGKIGYSVNYQKYYDNYEIYKNISYYYGWIKQIKGCESFKYYDDVWTLKKNGYSYRKGAAKLGISLDTYRTCIRSKTKIENNLIKIKKLKDIL